MRKDVASPTSLPVSPDRARSDGTFVTAKALVIFAVAAVLLNAPGLIFNLGVRNLDFNAHYAWAVQFGEGMRQGDLYPRWMWRGNLGSGEAALLFYSPLFYYLSGLVRLATSNTWEAMRIVFVVATFVTGIFAWRLLRLFTGAGFALIGAVLLQAAPMIVMLFYYFNDFPWATDFTALMALSYAVLRPGALQHRIDVRVSVAVAALVLIHLISALTALICFSALCLAHVRRDGARWHIERQVVSWFLSAGFGLALTLVYLLPALTLMREISPEVWTTLFTPWDAFAFPTITALLYGTHWFTFQWVVPMVALLTVLFATGYAWRRGGLDDQLGSALRLLLLVSWSSLFLASELSYPLWLLPTPLRDVQFPHRFIYITSATGLIANLLCLWELLRARRPILFRLLGAAPLLLGLALTVALEAKMILVDGKPLGLATDETEPYRGLAEYRLRTQGPDWDRYHREGGFDQECRRHGLVCRVLDQSSNRQAWAIEAGATSTIRLPVFAFPAWRVEIDGSAAASTIDPATGLILATVPSGSHRVSLNWVRLPIERAGAGLSLAAWILLAAIAFRRSRRAPRFGPAVGASGTASQSHRIKLMVTLGGGGFLLEAQSLLRGLGTDFDYCYITSDDCMVPKELAGAEIYRIRSFAVLGEPHLWQRGPAFLRALVQAYQALRRSKPDCVICVGSAMAVPIGLAARVLGIRSVFVESITRYDRPSMTARLVLLLRLANRFYVQWPDSTHLYRKGVYRGTVL
jgi:hypothetical protein